MQRNNFGPNTPDWWKTNFSDSAGPVFSLDINNPGIGFEGLDTISSETKTINGVSMRRDVYGDAATNQIGLILYAFDSGENNYLFIRQGGSVDDFDRAISTFKFIDEVEIGLLLKIVNSGGLCVDGPCHWETAIYSDGTIIVQGVTKKLASNELVDLNSSIAWTDFDQIRATPFTGTCPAAYDGPMYAFEFSASQGVEALNSCETEIDMEHQLFVFLSELLKKYTGIPLLLYP